MCVHVLNIRRHLLWDLLVQLWKLWHPMICHLENQGSQWWNSVKSLKPWEARVLQSKGRKWMFQLQNRENICLPEFFSDQMMLPHWGRGGSSLLSQSLQETTSQTCHLGILWFSQDDNYGIVPHFFGRHTWVWWGWLTMQDYARKKAPRPTLLPQNWVKNRTTFQSKNCPPCLFQVFCWSWHCFRPSPPHLPLPGMIQHLSCEK